MEEKIPGFKLLFNDTQISFILKEMEEILRSGMIVASKYVEKVENLSKVKLGIKYCYGVSSGTSALEMSALAVKKIKNNKRNKILVPVNTFIATSLAMEKAGFDIEFVDMEDKYLGMDLELAKNKIEKDDDIAAVTVVHIGGYINPELKEFSEWCRSRDIYLIEDCAHAYGSEKAGTFGDASGFSFFATKVFTGGEGGLVVTNNAEISDYLVLLRNFGKPEPWVTYHVDKGYNYRMSEFAALVLFSQLEQYDKILNERERIFQRYKEKLNSNIKLIEPGHRCSWYKITILSDKKEELVKTLNENNIFCPGSIYDTPLNKMPVYEKNVSGSFPAAEKFSRQHLCLPIFLDIKDEEIDRVCNIINKFNQ